MLARQLSAALVALAHLAPGADAANVQKPGLAVPAQYAAQQAQVKSIFQATYSKYRQFAFGHDELEPISKSFTDDLGGWGASMVDAMDTMLLMGFDDLFQEALNKSASINFNVSTPAGSSVSVFETTIRFVGGFISAYELSGKKFPILVEKAKQAANVIIHAFDGSKGVNFQRMVPATGAPVPGVSTIADAGTLTLEWDRLSLYTGNKTFQKLALQNVEYIAGLPAPLPGLAAQGIDPSTGQFSGSYVSWGGGSDSYFEYLLKYPRLTNAHDDLATVWRTAVDSSIKRLLSVSTVGHHWNLADQDDDGELRFIGSHLACFDGGNWLLGGQLLQNQTIVDVALQLVDTCWNTYASTATGIGPEAFAWISPQGNFSGATPSASDLAFYQKHGFYIYPGFPYWLQRPEVMESNFYAWRVTGDTKYLDRATQFIQSLEKFTRAPQTGAFAPINDVNNRSTTLMDESESFFYAEVLKYLWLTFDDPSKISLDNFVFNTECHPFAAPPAKSTYGSPPTLNPTGPVHGTPVVPGVIPMISPNSMAPKQISDLYIGL